MKKFKVGLLTMSDGRPYLHNLQYDMNMGYQKQIRERLEATGLVEVVEGSAPVNSNTAAKEEAMKLKDAGVEMTIFNYAIWCYPQYTAVATNFAPGPYLLFCNIHPSECGMVGMMAASGSLDQLEKTLHAYFRLHSRPDAVLAKVHAVHPRQLRRSAVCAVMTFGNFGGRPMGMYTDRRESRPVAAACSASTWKTSSRRRSCSAGRTRPIRRRMRARALKWLEAQRHGRHRLQRHQPHARPFCATQIRSYYGLTPDHRRARSWTSSASRLTAI